MKKNLKRTWKCLRVTEAVIRMKVKKLSTKTQYLLSKKKTKQRKRFRKNKMRCDSLLRNRCKRNKLLMMYRSRTL